MNEWNKFVYLDWFSKSLNKFYHKYVICESGICDSRYFGEYLFFVINTQCLDEPVILH